MSHEYERPVTPTSGLRLHLNENTAGCSPAVVEALRSITCTQAAYYPDYSGAIEACARHLGVADENLLLTNGLDEGILAISVAAFRRSPERSPFEALVVAPAFDMYAASADAAGGQVIEVRAPADFSFPLEEVLARINERTKLVFLTSPNNPTGLVVPRETILALADAAPHAMIFLDEAYADFSGTSLIGDPDSAKRSNVVIGRTFAKAYGLAGIRVGALIGTPETLMPIRRVVPPYSINIAAAAALPAALADRDHFDAYLRETSGSKQMLYEALDRLHVPYWRSEANFVFARFGDRAKQVVAGLQAKGIYVRDRSSEPSCAGCVRITAGVTSHTRECIAAIEEVLCPPQ
jgi:histidinol-phosphate aminotransferase